MVRSYVVDAQHKALFADTDAERNWWHGHATLVNEIMAKIIAGNSKI
jgi:hypothetical protein